MIKVENSQIKLFEFVDLGNGDSSQNNLSREFSFKPLSVSDDNSSLPSKEEIFKERESAQQNNFKIDEAVQKYRGLLEQEKLTLDKKIQEEVERSLSQIREQAYKEGFEKGRDEGLQSSLDEQKKIINEVSDKLFEILSDVQKRSQQMVEAKYDEIYTFLKRFIKWIVLKEAEDISYMERLLEKLLLELNSRSNLIIKTSEKFSSEMPDVIKKVESKLGHLSNARLEVLQDLSSPGIIVESENELIDGSIESLFQNIDQIFQKFHEQDHVQDIDQESSENGK